MQARKANRPDSNDERPYKISRHIRNFIFCCKPSVELFSSCKLKHSRNVKSSAGMYVSCENTLSHLNGTICT